MWLAPIIPLLLLATQPAGTAGSPAVSGPHLPEPILTRNTVFAIPYQIDRPSDPGQEPAEVHLYVSVDRGGTWRLYSKVSPTQRQFLFRASGDGDYWFLVRTLDRSGHVRPPWSNTPELRVVVDTTPPVLQLTALRGPAGQITARWEINEIHQRPESLSIQFRSDSTQQWQPIALDHRTWQISDSSFRGEVTWWPNTPGAQVQIRAEVSDAVGNTAISHLQVAMNEGAPAAPAGVPQPPAAPVKAPSPPPNPGPDNKTVWHSPAAPPIAIVPPQPVVSPPPANPVRAPLQAGGPILTADRPAQPEGAQSAGLISPGAGPAGLINVSQPGPPGGATAPPQIGAVAIEIRPPGNAYLAPSSGSVPVAAQQVPRGPRPRMVNSCVFEIDYDVPAAATSKTAQVEVWGTSDGGRSWQRYAAAPGDRNHLTIKVDREGLYGFRLAARGTPGRGTEPPRPGDPPEMLVGVDLTKPTGRILSAQQGWGEQLNRLTIAWEASDALLAERPIMLLIGPGPTGPWTPITRWLPNTGRYDWELDSHVPAQFNLRMEVRDAAGNVAFFDFPRPLAINRPPPTLRIRDVRPVGVQSLWPW